MRQALRLARRAWGETSPNPMVGAVLVKGGRVIGQGWHRRAGEPHAEIEALRDAERRGHSAAGATLYVTLEPCCTHGRTPPCTQSVIRAGVRHVVVAAIDPNSAHSGKGLDVLTQAGLRVTTGVLEAEAARLNEAFNHWIVHKTPFVVVKAAMTLDGKIATATGDSKWITGEEARTDGMRLRRGSDAILVGVNTILADDPSLTARTTAQSSEATRGAKLRRIVLDSHARTPSTAKVVSDALSHLTTIVVGTSAPASRVRRLARKVRVMQLPLAGGRISLSRLLRQLGKESVTRLLVEGGGEINASFLLQGLAHRVVFFYAPKILGGRAARSGVAGVGIKHLPDSIRLRDPEWRQTGSDWMMTARVEPLNHR